mgnify:CR=1 FL=1
MSLLPPRKPKEEIVMPLPEKHLHVESDTDPKDDALSREDKLFALIDKLTHDLNARSTDFAARRMDRGIKTALAGHTLEEIGR